MATNTTGLPVVPGARSLVSGGPPIVLGNEVRGGIHRISGSTGDTLGDIDGRSLQAGMLVYNEGTSQYFMYRNVGTAHTSPSDANDPFRGADGRLANNVGTIGAADSNWIEFRLSPEQLNDIGDVFANAPSNGQVLEYRTLDSDGDPLPAEQVGWYPSQDNVINSLQGLDDVTYGPAENRAEDQVLTITNVDSDGSNVVWGNRNLPTPNLSALQDVTYNTGTNAPAIGDILQIVSTQGGNIEWENATKGPLGSLDDVDFPIQPTHTQVLEYRTDIFNADDPANPLTGWTARTQIFGEEGGVFIDGTNAPTNGQVLAYRDRNADGTMLPLSQRGWYPATDSPLNNSIESLSDVNANLRPVGSILQYTGSANGWEDVLFNLGTLENLAQYDHLVYDGTQWLNEANHTPQYPTNQLIIADPDNAGQFIPNVFLYELRVDTNTDGTRTVTWMETPGNVDFTIQSRPDIDESETAFRRAPSQYVVNGFTGQDRDNAAQNLDTTVLNPDPCPLVWGAPVPRLTSLFPTQPLLYFFGQRQPGEDWFLREGTESIERLEGRVLYVNIDYAGVIRVSDNPGDNTLSATTKTTRLAADDPVLAPLRAAIPAGEYTGTVFTGRSYDPENSVFDGIWWVGFTELRDRQGVLYRVPEPPANPGNNVFGGIQFGTDNPDASPSISGTSSLIGSVQDAALSPNDPLFVFEHGGTSTETSIAGNPFIDVTRLPPDDPNNPADYDIIRITPNDTNPVIGISARANDGSVVTNTSSLDSRTSGVGQNRFPQVSAGTGIELRGTANNLEIVNTFQETDSDTTFARTTRSIARDGGVLTQEYVRGNASTNTTDFFRASGGANGIDYERPLTYQRTPATGNNNAQLIFNFLVTPRGTASPYSPTDIIRLRITSGTDTALINAGLAVGDYTAIVTSVGAEESGPTAALASYQITLDSIKRQSGGLPLEGPLLSVVVNQANIEENDIEVAGLTLTDAANVDTLDPFILVQHSPAEEENSAIRFVGGNEISVEETTPGVITINNTGGIPLFQQQHSYQVGDVFFTNNDATLIPTPGDRNKVFRVQTAFMSGVDLSTLNALNIIPIGDGSPGRAYYQFPDQRTLSYTNVTLRGGDIIDVFEGQPTPDPNDPDTLIPTTRTGSYMYSGTIDDPAGRFTDFPLELNTGIAPTQAGLAQNFIPFVTDQAALEFFTTETDGISGVDFHDGFAINTTAQREAATNLRRGTQYSTGTTSMASDVNPLGGAVLLQINNLQNYPAVTLSSRFWLNIPSGIWAGDYQIRPGGPADAGETEDTFANSLAPIIDGVVRNDSTISLTEGDLPINGVGLFEFVEEEIPAVQPRLNLTTQDNGTYQFTPQGMTLASGGFQLRTESSASPSNEISQLGDVALDGDGQETLQLFGDGWNVNFDPNRATPFDMTTLRVGDAIVMRAANGNTASRTEFRELVAAGDYLLIVNAPSPNANTMVLNNNSLKRINADGTIQNHVGGAEELAVFSLPFPADSLTFFRAHYHSEFSVETTNNTTEFGFSDRGLRTNGVIDINGDYFSSQTTANSFGTAISTTYPNNWQLLYTPTGTAIYRIVATGGSTFDTIGLGDRFLIRVTTASTDGRVPVGNYYGIRTNTIGTEGNDREIWFDPTQVYPINADGSIGDRLPINGASVPFAAGTDYSFATISINPELRATLHDGTFYQFEDDNLYITAPDGTRRAVGGGTIDGSGTANQLARWVDSDTLEGVDLNNLWPAADRTDNATLIPSAEYVLDATDYNPVFEMPTTSIDIVADQQYFVHVPAHNGIRPANNRPRVSLRDFRVNGANATTVQYWNELTDTWVDLSVFDNTSAATRLSSTQPLDSAGNNLFRITFNADARSNLVDNSDVIEEATVALRNPDGTTIVGGEKRGVTVGVNGYLPNSGVTPGTYLNADITVDAQGRVTSAINGAGGGGGRLPYPSTGGFAADDLGQVTHGASDVISWPSRSSLVQGISDITYTAQTGGAGSANATDVIGYFTNNTGGVIDLTSGRIDVDITIDSINASGDIQLVVRRATTNTGPSFASMSRTISGEGVVELSDTSLGDTNAMWQNGETLGFHIASSSGGIRPFTYTVNDVRVSLSQTQFTRQNIVSDFTGLSDTPSTYGTSGQVPVINTGSDGLVFSDVIGALYTRKSDLFLGTVGTTGTGANFPGSGTISGYSYTEYITRGVSYYFIDNGGMNAAGTAFTPTGDGIWTTDNPANGLITVANSAALTG